MTAVAVTVFREVGQLVRSHSVVKFCSLFPAVSEAQNDHRGCPDGYEVLVPSLSLGFSFPQAEAQGCALLGMALAFGAGAQLSVGGIVLGRPYPPACLSGELLSVDHLLGTAKESHFLEFFLGLEETKHPGYFH